MNSHARKVRVIASSSSGIFEGNYEEDICVGECIRNICVNLGIYPVTSNGITQNVSVSRLGMAGGMHEVWLYDPTQSIASAATPPGKLLSIQISVLENY